jgi:phenylalanine-4-hydroxylase
MKKSIRKFNPAIDDKNWSILFNTHFQNLQSLNSICTLWINGFSKLGINNSKRPLAEELTTAVQKYTPYTFVQTDDNVIFEQINWYTMIADYKMPLTNFVRTPEELNYCDEPDYWHDVMGHIPFLAEESYSHMYTLLARTYIAAYEAKRNDLLKQLDFIGGMIIELGLIREATGIKAFGSTFYSSGEVVEAFKKENQINFTPAALHSGESYDRHSFQGKYYIFDSLEQLVEVIVGIQTQIQDGKTT